MKTDFPQIFKENEAFPSFVRRLWDTKDFSQIERYVVERYPIKVTYFNIFASGYSNLNFIAETNLGKLIIRISKPKKGDNNFYFEEKISLYLKSKGISVRVPIRAKSGELYFNLPLGYTIEVLTYIEGKTWPDEWNLDVIASSGELLGKIHALGHDFKLSSDFQSLNIYEKFNNIKNVLATNKDVDREVLDSLIQCEHFLKKNSLEKRPQSILHGDFGPNNLVFKGNNVIGAFDFENANFGPSFYDIGMGVAQWLICQHSWDNKSILRSFQRGYSLHCPGFDEDLTLFMEKVCLLDRISATISFRKDYHSNKYWREELHLFEQLLHQVS